MSEFRRSQMDTLCKRLSEPPHRLIVVTGARQTGKTTATRQAVSSLRRPYRYEAADMPDERGVQAVPNLSQAVPYLSTEDGEGSVSFSAVRNRRWLEDVWRDSRRHAWQSARGFVLVLDDVQRIAGWSDSVKGLWDADRVSGCPLHVVIVRSTPMLMQAGLSESLAGRFESVRVTHWTFPEMSDAYGMDLEQYVYFGGYPGASRWIHDFERWSAYVREALIKPTIALDVLSMRRVEKPVLLKRLFELGATYSGQRLSYNKMLGQLHGAGNTTTLARYLTLLANAGLLTGLSKHTGRPVLTKASSPKLNVLNTALMAVTSGYTFAEARADRSQWGRMVESAVGAHLLNTSSPRTDVKYWRDGGHEVDFVVQRGPRTVAIEVKSGKGSEERSGLAEFERRFDPQATLVVGQDVELGEFLSQPTDHWIDAT